MLTPLQSVNLLNLVDEIGGQLLDALDGENIVRGRIAVDNIFALLDHVAVLKVNVLRLRDEVLDRLAAFLAWHDAKALLVLEVLSNCTVPEISAMIA